jgi:hypothetical protein
MMTGIMLPGGRGGQDVGPLPGQQPEGSRNRRQRRAQFVAHVRDKLVFQTLDMLAFADIEDHRKNQKQIAGMDRIKADFDGKFGTVFAPPE